MFGRALRKLISQAIAYGAYRFIGIWILVFVCATFRSNVGNAAICVIIAIDIIGTGISRGVEIALVQVRQEIWRHQLTNQLFVEHFYTTKQIFPSAIDIPESFKAAALAAKEDIEKASEDDRVDVGALDTTTWHWFGGFLSLLWLIIYAVLFYGSAITLGSQG